MLENRSVGSNSFSCVNRSPKVTSQPEEIFLAGGCLWGVQEFVRHLPGIISTEAGRANGSSYDTKGPYDGYAECVRAFFDPEVLSVDQLMLYFFEIIDPYSLNKQGPDEGEKYRTGVYSRNQSHLSSVRLIIERRDDATRIAVEVQPLTNYVRSDDEHQGRLTLHPAEPCHIAPELLHKYKKTLK
jgi:peptide-methionine (S)-S-oxide reductase